MRLLLDEHHDPEAARQLSARGHDVSALAARAHGRNLSDPEVLDLATTEERAVVTENARDFAVEHRRRLAAGVTHLGIIVTSPKRYPRGGRSMGRLVIALDHFLRAHSAADALRDQLIWLP